MGTTEPTINDSLAWLLRETRRAWLDSDVVRSQCTGMLMGCHAQPDIIVLEPHTSPVAVETEVLPAATVESDARGRIGREVSRTGRVVLSAVALRLPIRLREKQGQSLRTELATANDFEMALYTGRNPEDCVRWPGSGWLIGGIADLSMLVQSGSIPPAIIEDTADHLVKGVSAAAGLLGEIAESHPGAIHTMSEALRQEDCEQTRGMIATILVNAFVFQESLAGGPGELARVKSLEQLRDSSGALAKSVVMDEWDKILSVNYWPIFHIAREMLRVLPAGVCGPLFARLTATADALLAHQLMSSHDLTGAVFQRLIADRKFIAAFYTTPPSATLLVGLAIKPEATPAGGSWENASDVRAIRIADFACGTGTLLTTANRRMGQLHELAGGDAQALHPHMMAAGLTGCDILPAATHLTASMLAGTYPTVTYQQSSILTVAYGKQDDGSIALGSLDLLDPQGRFEILAITAKATGSMGETERQTWESLPHESFDVVIMNPPFTRPTGEGRESGIPNPMFAAFGYDAQEQRLMGRVARRLTAQTSAHGNAGEASVFLVLADRKLKPGGTLALVMPLSLFAGDAWEKSRALLACDYSDVVLVSIAGARDADMSFSADTGMGECLVVGRKTGTGNRRATFVMLKERPTLNLVGASAAEQIRRMIAVGGLRRLEEGPVGGSTLRFGDDVIGQALDGPLPASGGWRLARIADISLAQAAFQLVEASRLWLPSMNRSDAVGVSVTTVAALGRIGPGDRDINGDASGGGIRGPFDVSPRTAAGEPTYPILWAHHAARQRTLQFEPDCEGQPRRARSAAEQHAIELKVADVWATASHCHHNSDFRFNSQSTAMQFTPRPAIGGRAWPSILLKSEELEKALVLWTNTSLGLLLVWWHTNKEQSGRGSIRRVALRSLPVLDVTALSPTQLTAAVNIFDAMSGKPLLPLHQIHRDPVRKELDERFTREVLGLRESILSSNGPLELLRAKLRQGTTITYHS